MSEITSLMQQITAEQESAYRALYSPAIVANHDAILTHMQQGAEETLLPLFQAGRHEEAFALWEAGILEVQP